jgi:GNAT superfamily N-acetyltransferase
MIRQCRDSDFEPVYAIINDAARAYQDVIPADRWKEPYMPEEELRHAYVRTRHQNQGIGGRLLSTLRDQATGPLLVGTWADAVWAIRFYEKHGFRLVSPEEKTRLLREYWSIPERQVETSVVLADEQWFDWAGSQFEEKQ